MKRGVEAVSRIEEDREVIFAGKSGQFPIELNMDCYPIPKSLYSYENLLVMVPHLPPFMDSPGQNYKVCLWNGETKARCADLGLEAGILEPGDSIYFVDDVAVSKDMLAVLVTVSIRTGRGEVQRALLWRVNTSQPEALAPQFIGKVTFTFKGNSVGKDLLLMNDRFFCKYHREDTGKARGQTEVLFIEKAVLMNEDQTRVVSREQMANSNNLGNSWKRETGNSWKSETGKRWKSETGNSCFSDSDDEEDSDEEESDDEYESYYEDEEDYKNSFFQGSSRVSNFREVQEAARWSTSEDALFLEPGSSSRLAIFIPWLQTLKILDLALSEPVIVDIYVGANLFPANWCGGNLLFLKDLQRGGEGQEAGYGVQVRIGNKKPTKKNHPLKMFFWGVFGVFLNFKFFMKIIQTFLFETNLL
jgi:hypothetical protein